VCGACGRARAWAAGRARRRPSPPPFPSAVRDRPTALVRHLADSWDFLPSLDAAAAASAAARGAQPFTVVDVGSGAGFPGAALAAARPAWNVTLLDARRKRCDFCAGAAAGAGLANVATLWARAEAAGAVASPRRGAADAVVARAVAELRVLAELCLPLVAVGGVFVAAKGPAPDAEVAAAVAAIAAAGGGGAEVVRLAPLPGGGTPARSLVLIRKIAPTPPGLPRRAGVALKRPL